jgi:HAD superfamily hydrolase (TIGR01509 family)
MNLQALLWDVDGTLAETERDGHRVAFNQAFQACNLPWRWSVERYGELLSVTGGRERLLHDMATQPGAPTMRGEREALASDVHARKNAMYADLVRSPGIPLRPGVRELMEECRERGVRLAITTTTSRSNVEALMRAHLGPHWRSWFAAVICGEDVARKKPDPEVYRQALLQLGIAPLAAVAVEDSPGGVAAARAADIPVIATRSAYFATAPIDGAIAIGPGFGQRVGWRPAIPCMEPNSLVELDDVNDWRHRMEHTSQFW